MSHGLGSVQQKVLLLLLGGSSLCLSTSPKQQFKILKAIEKGWREINQQSLKRAIQNLYKSKLISCEEKANGEVKLVLTANGRKRALVHQLDKMEIQRPAKWDGKWRVVIFDVPEIKRKIRNALRFHLKQLGFYELQKSVFVFPFDCQNEIDFLIEFYNVRKFVRFMIANFLDNELHLKKIFGLL